ncbi:synaptic vesicle 2-related protein-like isoform X2 [Oscarella lobularis]|uniref:synaptic vesicle 2-related protein-like isoform X2 n=1 Tax=Oscarella lobularis TaxID=121494 RepID=UPI0033143BF8
MSFLCYMQSRALRTTSGMSGMRNAEAAHSETVREVYTVEEAIECIGFGRFQLKMFVFAGLLWMVESMEIMLVSVLAVAVRCDYDLDSWGESVLTLVMFVGMFFGATFWGVIADKFGRKKALLIVSICVSLSSLISAFSPNYIFLVIIRGILGFSIAGGGQTVNFYAEFLPIKHRGYTTLLVLLFYVCGALVEAVLALLLMGYAGLNWHYFLAFSAIPSCLFLLYFKFIPESPRYYLVSNQIPKAKKVLEQAAKQNGKSLPPGELVFEKESIMLHALSGDSHSDTEASDSEGADSLIIPDENVTSRGKLKDLFSTKERGITTVLLWIIFFAGTSGFYGLILATTELLAITDELKTENVTDGTYLPCIDHKSIPMNSSQCQLLGIDDYIKLVWVNAADAPGILLAIPLIEKIGRRKTMAVEFFLTGASFFLFFICPISKDVLTAFVFLVRVLLNGSLCTLWVYTPEVYPTAVRGIGLGSSSSSARIGAMLTPFIAEVLLRKSIRASLGIYAGLFLICAVCSLRLPIETKKRSLEDKA